MVYIRLRNATMHLDKGFNPPPPTFKTPLLLCISFIYTDCMCISMEQFLQLQLKLKFLKLVFAFSSIPTVLDSLLTDGSGAWKNLAGDTSWWLCFSDATSSLALTPAGWPAQRQGVTTVALNHYSEQLTQQLTPFSLVSLFSQVRVYSLETCTMIKCVIHFKSLLSIFISV